MTCDICLHPQCPGWHGNARSVETSEHPLHCAGPISCENCQQEQDDANICHNCGNDVPLKHLEPDT